ncbi:MAG TPA: hypothetical protein VIT62_09710 [Lysobacter sp.]
MNPAGFERSAKDSAQAEGNISARVKASFDRVAFRCRRFAGEEIGPQRILELQAKAASQGDLTAEIDIFSQAAPLHPDGPSFSDERRILLMQRALASRDPTAIAAMASLMGVTARPGFAGSMPAGSLRSEAAWNLAACQLGMDCGPSSSLVVSACVFGGICGFNSVADLYSRGLLPLSETPYLNKEILLVVNGAAQHGNNQ